MADDPNKSETARSAISGGRKRTPPTLDLTATDTTPASDRPKDAAPPPPDAVTEPAVETPAGSSAESPLAAEAATAPGDDAKPAEGTKFSFAPDADRAEPNAADTNSADTNASDSASPEPYAAGEQLPPPPPPPPAAAPRSSFAGAFVAGALGAVLMLVVLGMLWVSGQFGGDAAMLAERTARVENQLRALAERPAASPSAPAFDAGRLDDVAKRLAALETKPAPAGGAPDTALVGRVTSLENTVKALSARLDQTANTAREAVAQSAQPSVPPAEIEALNTRVAALDRGIKALQDDVTKRFASGLTDPAARRAVTAEALRVAVERGEAFADQLKAAQPLAAGNALAPLQPFAQQGVPTVAALSRELTALLPALRGAQPAAQNAEAGFMQRLSANAEKLVRVRPVNEVAGDDPAATLTRIEVRAQQNDIDSALAELNKLPPEARAPADAWIKKAQARRDAVQAARQFANTSLNQLTP